MLNEAIGILVKERLRFDADQRNGCRAGDGVTRKGMLAASELDGQGTFLPGTSERPMALLVP
jgi:hypothetical protein